VTIRAANDRAGFVYPERLVRDERERSNALTRLIAVTVLIASVAVVATTVSFGRASGEGFAAAPVPAHAVGWAERQRNPSGFAQRFDI
jgi:hypothetical protein